VHRRFDQAQTPYQRLAAAGVLSSTTHADLEALYQRLNPLQLRRDLEAALDRLWTLAAPEPHRSSGHTEIATPLVKSSPRATEVFASVTPTFESTNTGG
jgi:hypothetical protein